MGLGQTSNDCFIVNGVLHKYDGAFFGDFHVSQFKNLDVLVGSYPICEDDCNQLSFKGVTGVLNLLTDAEMNDLNYSKPQILKYCGASNIKFTKNISIDEHNSLSQDNLNNLLSAAAYLDDMVNNKNLRVFVHCTSGHTRAMSVVMVYLSIYKKHPDWNDLDKLNQQLASQYALSFPNIKAVEKVVQQNKNF